MDIVAEGVGIDDEGSILLHFCYPHCVDHTLTVEQAAALGTRLAEAAAKLKAESEVA